MHFSIMVSQPSLNILRYSLKEVKSVFKLWPTFWRISLGTNIHLAPTFGAIYVPKRLPLYLFWVNLCLRSVISKIYLWHISGRNETERVAPETLEVTPKVHRDKSNALGKFNSRTLSKINSNGGEHHPAERLTWLKPF